ncbi:MAG: hypothetical protein C4518_02135 [Desulfobacteraceae bacterium]|nr:MAG: hypothetical protein C4518_02135 [Desulfobacteraceae bacterium]
MWKDHLLKFINNYTIKKQIITISGLLMKLTTVWIILLILPAYGFAQKKGLADAVSGGEKIQIAADRLVASQNNQMVVFSGHVKATHGKVTILSDTLNVFYSDPKTSTSKGYNKDSIQRIVASGNVTIEMEGKTATCDQAVYQTSTKSMTLTGDNTRIQSGDNYITGKTVTIYQDTGQITVDGNDTERVNAVFQPEDKSIATDFK